MSAIRILLQVLGALFIGAAIGRCAENRFDASPDAGRVWMWGIAILLVFVCRIG